MNQERATSMRWSAQSVIRISLYALICTLVIGSAFAMGYATRAAQAPLSREVPGFSVFWEAWDLVDDHFYGDASDQVARTHGAIEGSLNALEDPYTVFVEPRQRDREQEELRGSFGGIGAWIERRPDGSFVLTPMEGRPAERAGILAEDELIAVDGVPLSSEMSLDQVLDRVRGEVGDVVRLTIRRKGLSEPITFEVERAEIITPSATWEFIEPDIGYVHLTLFNERTEQELLDAIAKLRDQGAAKFVIDLRDNGGGLLTSAVDIASQFLRDGMVLYERKADGQERAYPVETEGSLRDDPVVFLVNGATASASEIVAGAIQHYGRGKLIGTKTFGKASVQLLFDLSDGSSIHVTNAHWLTPGQQEIDGAGLTPDIVVELTDDDRLNGRDPQLDQAIAYLQGSQP
jgi:carboxyl-terminal processing protease